jgi:hypothetical protein
MTGVIWATHGCCQPTKFPKTNALGFFAIAAFKPILTPDPPVQSRFAAPHLSHIPRPFFTNRDCRGALQASSAIRAVSPHRSLTGARAARHRHFGIRSGQGRNEGAAVLQFRLKARREFRGSGFGPGQAAHSSSERSGFPGRRSRQ